MIHSDALVCAINSTFFIYIFRIRFPILFCCVNFFFWIATRLDAIKIGCTGRTLAFPHKINSIENLERIRAPYTCNDQNHQILVYIFVDFFLFCFFFFDFNFCTILHANSLLFFFFCATQRQCKVLYMRVCSLNENDRTTI